MNDLIYTVANHRFILRVSEIEAVELLLPSYKPFQDVENGAVAKEILFTLTFVDKPLDGLVTREVTNFEWDDAHCSVERTNTEGHLFRLTPKESSTTYVLVTNSSFSEAKFFPGEWNMVSGQHISGQTSSWEIAFVLNNLLMMLYAFAASRYATLMLHASVIRCNGRGFLFLGRSGTGKSTHSRLWLSHIKDAKLLNDDNPVIRVENGNVRVYGTPWSGKTPCYCNESVPVGAIIRLTQAPENKIVRHKSLQAFASLFPSCSQMPWEEEIHNGVCSTITALVKTVPVFALACLPDRAAAELCYKTVMECCGE